MSKITQRTFIENKQVLKFLQELGVNMLAGDSESKNMESHSYYGLDFMLRYIHTGFSKDKLEIVHVSDLPPMLKEGFKEHLMDLFEK